MFKAARDDQDGSFDPDDDWINNNLHMLIKDNTPLMKSSKYSNKVKIDCEFCGQKHDSKNDMCLI